MSLFSKAARFAQSPKGKKLVRQAQDAANKPENKRKIAEVRERLAKKR